MIIDDINIKTEYSEDRKKKLLKATVTMNGKQHVFSTNALTTLYYYIYYLIFEDEAINNTILKHLIFGASEEQLENAKEIIEWILHQE